MNSRIKVSPFTSSLGRCQLLLLRIGSVHLEILGYPIGDA